MDQTLYFTCRYNFQLSHHLKLIKAFPHLVISHLQVVRTMITIKITIKNFMLWFHYPCQRSYINYELQYSQSCVNMHLNRNHEISTEIYNSRLNLGKHLRTQVKTPWKNDSATQVVRETDQYIGHEHRVLTHWHQCIIGCWSLLAQLKHELRKRFWNQRSSLQSQLKDSHSTSLWLLPASNQV